MGDAAGGDEARCGGDPGHHAAHGGRPARPAGAWGRPPRRRRRSRLGKFEDVAGDYTRIAVGGAPSGWHAYADAEGAPTAFEPDGVTDGADSLLLYFTSGTTAKPKLVEHTHASYPVGHLSTMYWIGLQPGDVHLNISSPGWAKHAWSNVFAPWIAEACVLVMNYSRFDAESLLAVLERCGVTSFCAPPTVWRMLIQADLSALAVPPANVVGAGEPLNPEVIEQVEKAWGVQIRDGFGQTETTLQIGNPPGQPIKPGSMGRPIPGYPIVLVDPVTGEPSDDGEICIDLARRPLGLMVGYHGDPDRNDEAMAGGYYHTGDVGTRDGDGYITYVGRSDDVFKASDYRISPFELESVLIEHPAVAEAAVVPSPDPVRLAVPKAYVVLAAGYEPSEETAQSILEFARENLAPYKRIRRLEFAPLPKTISGKIRRVELRGREADQRRRGAAGGGGVHDLASTSRITSVRAHGRDPRRVDPEVDLACGVEWIAQDPQCRPIEWPSVPELPHEEQSDNDAVLRYGTDGPLTELVCGGLRLEHPSARRLVDALPAVVHVRTARRSVLGVTLDLLADEVQGRPLPRGPRPARNGVFDRRAHAAGRGPAPSRRSDGRRGRRRRRLRVRRFLQPGVQAPRRPPAPRVPAGRLRAGPVQGSTGCQTPRPWTSCPPSASCCGPRG